MGDPSETEAGSHHSDSGASRAKAFLMCAVPPRGQGERRREHGGGPGPSGKGARADAGRSVVDPSRLRHAASTVRYAAHIPARRRGRRRGRAVAGRRRRAPRSRPVRGGPRIETRPRDRTGPRAAGSDRRDVRTRRDGADRPPLRQRGRRRQGRGLRRLHRGRPERPLGGRRDPCEGALVQRGTDLRGRDVRDEGVRGAHGSPHRRA